MQVQKEGAEPWALGPWVADGKESWLASINAVYWDIDRDRAANWNNWRKVNQGLRDTLERRYQDAGFHAPRLAWDALWRRVARWQPAPDAEAHIRLVEAFFTDAAPAFWEHVAYRHRHGGNVHVSFFGGTGMTKSSCMVAIADRIKPTAPERLPSLLSVDIGQLAANLRDLEELETLMHDELLRLAGEGANTQLALFANLEDTLRATRGNLFTAGPARRDTSHPMQLDLEVVLWDPGRKVTLFIVWFEGVPAGVMQVPWCPPHLWEPYSRFKADNVRRTRSAAFRDRHFMVRSVLHVTSDPAFVDYVVTTAKKPKKADLKRALALFNAEMMTTQQQDELAGNLFQLAQDLGRYKDKFAGWFGAEPNEGLLAISKLYYKER